MSQEQINISHMQCWLFRLAQRKWNKTSKETATLFREFDLFGYISDCYDILHLSSYQYALSDVEQYLARKGVVVC